MAQDKGTEARNRQAQRIKAMRKELKVLRDATIRAHANSTAHYIQSDTEMKFRTARVLTNALNRSEYCLKLLGYYPNPVPMPTKSVTRHCQPTMGVVYQPRPHNLQPGRD